MTTFRLKAHSQWHTFSKPAVMGIINLTKESFFNRFLSVGAVVDAAASMVSSGAELIDLGAEATNPNVVLQHLDTAKATSEIERLVPAIEAIKKRFPLFISVDTSQPAVMIAAANAGADMINDQRCLQVPDALEAAASSGCAICLMHSFIPIRQPGSTTPDVLLSSIIEEMVKQISRCERAGVHADRLVVDPGFGQGHYGKNTAENCYLLNHLESLSVLERPILVGWSRKSMLGDLLNQPVSERLVGSIAAACLAADRGAAIIRAHDVPETVSACRLVSAVLG